MTDNIFESDTALVALRTCYSEDPGLLLLRAPKRGPQMDLLGFGAGPRPSVAAAFSPWCLRLLFYLVSSTLAPLVGSLQ